MTYNGHRGGVWLIWRYRPEPKPQRRSRWGGWHLWHEIEPKAERQADLSGAAGASYRGGGSGAKRPQTAAVLRPGVLHAVEHFIRVNQPPGGASGWYR